MTLIQSIKELSSGTLGTLTNERNYDKLEEIRNDFLSFSKSLPQDLIWQVAWKRYIPNKM